MKFKSIQRQNIKCICFDSHKQDIPLTLKDLLFGLVVVLLYTGLTGTEEHKYSTNAPFDLFLF